MKKSFIVWSFFYVLNLKRRSLYAKSTRESPTKPRRILCLSRYRQNQSTRITERPLKHFYNQNRQPLLRQQEVTRQMA